MPVASFLHRDTTRQLSLLSNPEIMQQEDDLRGLSKLMHLMRGISLLILCSHIYWYCHTWLSSQG